MIEGIDTLTKITVRKARTLTNLELDTEVYRLPSLKDVGSGDVVWGTPVKAAETAKALGSYEVIVESYRPLNLCVAEVRVFVPSQGFA